MSVTSYRVAQRSRSSSTSNSAITIEALQLEPPQGVGLPWAGVYQGIRRFFALTGILLGSRNVRFPWISPKGQAGQNLFQEPIWRAV